MPVFGGYPIFCKETVHVDMTFCLYEAGFKLYMVDVSMIQNELYNHQISPLFSK